MSNRRERFGGLSRKNGRDGREIAHKALTTRTRGPVERLQKLTDPRELSRRIYEWRTVFLFGVGLRLAPLVPNRGG